jgi:carbamoylphosphate synthase large subunit
MQVDLYQTLKSINVADDQAKLVVASLEDHIDDVVRDATKPLQEKLDGLHRSLETHMKTQTWVISVIGFTIFALTAIGTFVTILRH